MQWRTHFSELVVPQTVSVTGARTAGVLVPIGVDREQGEVVVLTKRTQHVKTHKGQMSFPGGLWEPGDRSLEDTALREAEEEIGLSRGDVEVVGALPVVQTQGALPIQPWLGYFSLPYPFQESPDEVDQILLLPVSRLMEERLSEVNVAVGPYHFRGPGIQVEGELVWGATARILQGLLPKP